MKSNEKLLDIIGEIDEGSVPEMSEKGRKRSYIKWTAIGGGLCAAAILGIVIFAQSDFFWKDRVNPDHPLTGDSSYKEYPDRIYPYYSYQAEEDKELVPVTPQVVSGGMGFEGYNVYDISELEDKFGSNPWSADMELEALPVFRNLAYEGYLNRYGVHIYLTEEQLETMAKNTALALGTEITSSYFSYESFITEYEVPPTPEQLAGGVNMACQITAECSDGTKIEVSGDGGIRIEFDPAVQLPEDYSFDSPEKKNEAMEYLAEKYSELLQFDDPEFFSYTDIYKCVYDKSGDEVQRILNYNLCFDRFCIDQDNGLFIIYMDNVLVSSEYLGNYPIISLDEGLQMLLDGKYLTTVPEDYKNGVMSEEIIARAELVYRNSSGLDEYYQPYYRFLVELDMGEEFAEEYPGRTNYGAFYVPAVHEEYLSELTVWNGAFN